MCNRFKEKDQNEGHTGRQASRMNKYLFLKPTGGEIKAGMEANNNKRTADLRHLGSKKSQSTIRVNQVETKN